MSDAGRSFYSLGNNFSFSDTSSGITDIGRPIRFLHCKNCLKWTLTKPVCHSAATERWILTHLVSLYQRFMTLSQMNASRPHTWRRANHFHLPRYNYMAEDIYRGRHRRNLYCLVQRAQQYSIGLYRDVWIAAIAWSRTSLATLETCLPWK